MNPVDDRAVQDPGRAEQAVGEVAQPAADGQGGAEPLDGAGGVPGPEPEQHDADGTGQDHERLVAGAEAERGAVVGDQSQPDQASGHRDLVAGPERGQGPCLGRHVGGQGKDRDPGPEQDRPGPGRGAGAERCGRGGSPEPTRTSHDDTQ